MNYTLEYQNSSFQVNSFTLQIHFEFVFLKSTSLTSAFKYAEKTFYNLNCAVGLRQFYEMFGHYDHVMPKGLLRRVDHNLIASCIHKNKNEHFKHLDMIDYEECTNFNFFVLLSRAALRAARLKKIESKKCAYKVCLNR